MQEIRTHRPSEQIARHIRQARGLEPADLVIKNASLLSLITGDYHQGDIALCGDTIIGVQSCYEGRETYDAKGLVAVPGFIDTHVHIESSLTVPEEFERCVLPHGTTTVICDPHEIANVAGLEGVRYFLDSATKSTLSIFVQLSSCVPATDMETSAFALDSKALKSLIDHPGALGLAEFMNFPGVLFEDKGVLEKLEAFSSYHIDGHAPLLSGKDLNAYLAAGIRTDHECSRLEEAREKMEKGMIILIREGSVSKDLHALIPLISAETSSRLAFCTDDRNPLDIAEEGHLDFMIAEAIKAGAPLHHVYRMASLSAAQAFGFTTRGLIAPGFRGDIVLLDNVKTCSIAEVFCGGTPISRALSQKKSPLPYPAQNSVHLPPLDDESFHNHGTPETPVIVVDPGKIITRRIDVTLSINEQGRSVDLERDFIKVAVIERHGRNGNIGLGFVNGFKLNRGAIASSVGHDSHNICVIGVNDSAMRLAVERLAAIQGGFVVVDGDQVTAELALPIGGLMTDIAFDRITEALIPLRQAARDLGCDLPEPFLQIGFLPLPVIPHLKLTDKGLVDVDRFTIIEKGKPGTVIGNKRT